MNSIRAFFFLLWDDDGINVQNQNRQREILPRINFPKSIYTFREDFRVDPEAAEYILRGIGHRIEHETMYNNALNSKQQLLLTLHYLGINSPYHAIGSMHGIHKSTVCRCIHNTVKAIIDAFYRSFVRWPNSNDSSRKFYEIAGFPDCGGIIDGTLVNFIPHHDIEASFVDRHNNHSINLTLVCGPNYEFFYSNARFSGSCHDSRVLRESNLWQKWNNEGNLEF